MMPDQEIIDAAVLSTKVPIYQPTITIWNRLEGRPRTENFERALRAEVRDPLWMLSKQWQMGEFQGEDAASAILAKVHIKTTSLTKYQSSESTAMPFDASVPLEVKVENQKIPFKIGGQDMSLDLRLLMGRHWLKLLKSENLLSLKAAYLSNYGFSIPDPEAESDVQVCAHQEVWQLFAAVSKRSIDGYKLYQDLFLVADKVTAPDIDEENILVDVRDKFVRWFNNLYYHPVEDDDNPSWKPERLEYQFSCSAPEKEKEKVLIADEYYQGHLDWYNLDVHDSKRKLSDVDEPNTSASVENTFTLSFLPSPITFGGMPHSRWWAFEDLKTNLGLINPNTTDINQLLILDFALNYANDWGMLPLTMPVGSLANVEGLMVTNVFGEHIWIEASGKGRDEEWNRWSMFHLNTKGERDVPADLSLLLLPAAPKVLEGKPLEEVYFLRDEVANMVWGLDSLIPLATGKSKSGKEAGLEIRSKYEQLSLKVDSPLLIQNEAKIKYQIVNSVPENWIPFIPVHQQNDNRQIQLQRAAMPRILEGVDHTLPPRKIEPRTSILREELEGEVKKPYFLYEEEVPKVGIEVQKSFQRTRWKNGRVLTWIGYKKQIGRGNGHSGLAFDQILPKK